MLEYDPLTSLRHWPLPMARFGLNPYGGNLYRIVFAPSRRRLICGEWSDGSTKAQWMRAYPDMGNIWIMEKWCSAEEFGGTKKRWDLECQSLGPWPDRGEYEICHSFETSTPDDAALEKLICWIEMGRKTSFFETQTFIKRDVDREKRAVSDQQDAMIRNWLPAFGTAPMIGRGGGRGTKTMPILKSANELGLPTQGGQMRTRPNPNAPKFSVDLAEAVR